jgi:hypothetical protein
MAFSDFKGRYMQALGFKVDTEFEGGCLRVGSILASGKGQAEGDTTAVYCFDDHTAAPCSALARSDTWTLQKCP